MNQWFFTNYIILVTKASMSNTLKNPPNIYLNSFKPLCLTKFGQLSADQHSLPPYIDGSCRREPDFQNLYPSITSTCRAAGFAPHLYPNDVVVYITTKAKYGESYLHNKLVAILQVIERKENHTEAADWYKKKKVKLPSNCFVEGNGPMSFDMTCGLSERKPEFSFKLLKANLRLQEKAIEEWDMSYKERIRKYPVFIITKPIYIELTDPIPLTADDLIDITGKLPFTLSKCKISKSALRRFADNVEIKLSFS